MKVRKKDVLKAERDYASAVKISTNPDRDLAVDRALGRWQDLKELWEKQKTKINS